jgi:nucleotide-binding universal stress UspA family protein
MTGACGAPGGGQVIEADFAEALAGWRERFPGVRVRTDMVHAKPVDALSAASDCADVLVVGSHGHREVTGLLLGSVSQAMVHHARCPLVVVHNSSATWR